MIVTTTHHVEGREVTEDLGIVSGECVYGANVFRDLFASIRDIVGGRTGGYEKVLREGRNTALDDLWGEARRLGADAVIGVDLDYETIGGSMPMVSANGTAVKLSLPV